MARGAFQGTWSPNLRPTVVTAPDVVVFINGESDVLGCGKCKRRFDFNKYVTSVQVDLSIESIPGSASIGLSVPRHAIDDFMFEGIPIVTSMMEVEIYAKGYYTVEGMPQYYPIFWGMITEVSDNYSAGEHTFSLSCSDILKWWDICKMNANPAFTQQAGSLGRNIFGNVFFGKNPYDVIWTLAQQGFGDVILGTGSLISVYKEATQRDTFNRSLGDIMQYWQQRFGRIRNNLVLYGARGIAVRGDTLYQNYKGGAGNASTWASQAVRQANGGDDSSSQMIFDPTDSNVNAYRTQFMNAGAVNFWQSEYLTKIEVAQQAKDSIGYEFYMDVDGSIVFKPPFYNLDTIPNKPVSWIQDIDIIDWAFTDSEAEVITQLTVSGNFGGNTDYGIAEEAAPYTSVTDYHLLRKYGWRSQTYNSEFLADPQAMFYVGMDVLDRINAKRHRATVNIPCRPEMRLGFPVYIEPKDQYWYVTGISHNIPLGGRAQTTLSLSARRTKFVAPRGIGTLHLTSVDGDTTKIQPQTKTDVRAKPDNVPPNDKPTETLPKPKKYSSQTLGVKGNFEIRVGDAAELPPSNAIDNARAYEPLLLRHPKTGRQLGYPNVCMVYTRPFNPTKEQLQSLKGQKNPAPKGGNNAQKMMKNAQKPLEEELKKTDAALYNYQDKDLLRDIHMSNRYHYGLNSAGVYTYVQDMSKQIDEILILPRSKLKVADEPASESQTPSNDAIKASARAALRAKDTGSGLIRPVSDSRGFEVIGHYKYGRGLSLRDGSLVLTDGGDNKRANVAIQMALSGDLFATLTAQSRGLTTALDAPNPVTSIVDLKPEDLQTGGFINPDTKRPEFTGTETNFVEARPLNSPEAAGVMISVEASQLAKAVTLTELTALRSGFSNDTNCECMASRKDLWFMNLNTKISAVAANGSLSDLSTLGPDGILSEFQSPDQVEARARVRQEVEAAVAKGEVASIKSYQTALRKIQEELLAAPTDPLRIRDGDHPEVTFTLDDLLDPNFSTFLRDKMPISQMKTTEKIVKDKIAELTKDAIVEAQGQAGLITPDQVELLKSTPRDMKVPFDMGNLQSAQSYVGIIDKYLKNMYSVLDRPHQDDEKLLRGEYIKQPREPRNDATLATNSSGQTVLAAPFSVPGRARGGDPTALALTASTAIDQAATTWSDFGTKLKNNSERADQQSQLDNAIKDRNRNKLERDQLAAQANTTSLPYDREARIRDLDALIAKSQAEIDNAQLKLSQT